MQPTTTNPTAKPALPWGPGDIYSKPYRTAAILELARIGDDPAVAAEAIRAMRILLPACRVTSSAVPIAEIRGLTEKYREQVSRPMMHLLATAAGMQEPDFPTLCRYELGLEVPKIPIPDKIFCQMVARAGVGAMTDMQRIAISLILHPLGRPFLVGVSEIFPVQYAAAQTSDGEDGGSGGGSGEAGASAALAPVPAPAPADDDKDQAKGAFAVLAAALSAVDDDPSP